jgi:drug/metabolite transporter (DMT)-like permease
MNFMQFLLTPRLRLFVGAFLISFSPIFVGLANVSPTVSGFYRVFIGGIVLTFFVLISGRRFNFIYATWIAIIASAAFFAADLWFWHRSVLYIGPGLGTLLANMQVFFMMAAGILIYKEQPSHTQIMAVPIAVIGLIMAVGFDWGALSSDFQIGVIFGFLTAISYSGYLLLMRQAQVHSSYAMPIREIAVMSLLVSIFLGFSVIFEGESLLIPSSYDLLILLLYGVASHAIGGILIASALVKVQAAEVGIVLLLQPSLSYIWEAIFFQKSFIFIESLGVIIVLFAIYLSSKRTV